MSSVNVKFKRNFHSEGLMTWPKFLQKLLLTQKQKKTDRSKAVKVVIMGVTRKLGLWLLQSYCAMRVIMSYLPGI